MKGLSSLERIVLECVGARSLQYHEIQAQSGLHENVCFNITQALVIRGFLKVNGSYYQAREDISPLLMEEINGQEAKEAECLELMEAVLGHKGRKTFKLRKVAMDDRDEKIFLAMLSNLECFLDDVHEKSEALTPLKSRKVVFWGVGEVQSLMNQILVGR